MFLRRTVPAILIALGLAVCLAIPASTQNTARYRFTRVAESREEGVALSSPVINNLGQVAFLIQTRRTEPDGSEVPDIRIFRAAGARRTLIAHRPEIRDVGILALNDWGDVAFPATLAEGGEAIYRGRGGPLTLIAATAPGVFDSFTFEVAINDRRTVAFAPDFENGDEGVLLGQGGPPAPVFLASTGPLRGNPPPAINDLGHVAFNAYTKTGEGVFIWERGRFVEVASTNGPLFQVFSDVKLNNRGQVAFTATVDDEDNQPGPLTLFIGSEHTLRKIADTTGVFNDFISDPSINDRGQILFRGELDGKGEELPQGLFLVTGARITPVLRTGDALDGSRVVGARLSEGKALNNRGQFAFGAHLADGRFATYVATPRAGSRE